MRTATEHACEEPIVLEDPGGLYADAIAGFAVATRSRADAP